MTNPYVFRQQVTKSRNHPDHNKADNARPRKEPIIMNGGKERPVVEVNPDDIAVDSDFTEQEDAKPEKVAASEEDTSEVTEVTADSAAKRKRTWKGKKIKDARKDRVIPQSALIAHLANTVFSNLEQPLNKADAAALLNGLCDEIHNLVVEGYRIKLPELGTLQCTERAARQGRNPRTGETLDIPSKKMISFKMSPEVKDKINK